MRKLLLSLSALVIFGLPKMSAQLINPDFETWTTDALAASAKDPNTGNNSSGWWDFNMDNSSFFGSSPVTVFQDSVNPAPHSGKYCAEIVSQTMASGTYTTLKGYGFAYPQTNGIIVTAFLNAGFGLTYKPGIAFNKRIDTFSFWYRYIPNGSDTCSCYIQLTHSHHLLGGAYWKNAATVSSWTQAKVPIFYDSANGNPDTVFIQFSACSLYSNPQAGDTMNIDGSSVILGINDITVEHHDNVNLYPNPANTQINLAVSGQFQAATIEVYDITGRAIGTYSIRNNFLTVNTQAYNSGLYFYRLLDNTGVQLNVGKFSVVR